MNELCVFLFGALFGGLIAAVIAVFYGMYCKEKLNAEIQKTKIRCESKERYASNIRQGGDDF